jgi:hypothetical protein
MSVSEILKDLNVPSHARREGTGRLAERRVKDQRSNQSNLTGHPVQELADQLTSLDKGRELLYGQSDASLMKADIIPKVLSKISAIFLSL